MEHDSDVCRFCASEGQYFAAGAEDRFHWALYIVMDLTLIFQMQLKRGEKKEKDQALTPSMQYPGIVRR